MVVDGVVFSIAQTAEQEFMFDSYVNQIREATKIDEVIMAVTARDGNFRKLVLPSYKATRAYTPKPVGYPQLLEYINETYGTICTPMIEADDLIGIIGSTGTYKGKEVVILSDDKDLLTIPCKYVDTKDNFKIKTQSKLEADHFFFTQVLTGDTTDNYKGCIGCGPVKAAKILAKAEDEWDGTDPDELPRLWWKAIAEAFEKSGQGLDAAIVQAQMARILRVDDWDEVKQKPILWTPETLDPK